MKQNKNVIRLTESQLRQMITESVKRILKESDNWNERQESMEQIPSWALNYLINGDSDNLNYEEIAEIENWQKASNIYEVCPPDGEEYFCKYPAFGEPCSVYDCICFYR